MSATCRSLVLDGDVRLYEAMPDTVTLHAADGTIRLCRVRQPIDDPNKYIGTHPSAWIDPQCHKAVKAALAAASDGKVATCRYRLLASLYGGQSWDVETEWSPSGCATRPILGISRTVAAIPKLTPTEKKLVKLIPIKNAASIAAMLGIKSSSVRAAKARLARKLNISVAELPAFCASNGDMV